MVHPDRVDKLITMGGPEISQPNIFSPGGFSLGLQEVYRGYTDRSREAFRRLVDVMTFDDRFLADELIERRLSDALLRSHHLDAFVKRAGMPPADDRLEWTPKRLMAITAPTLLIHGRDDQVVPFESSLRLMALIPNSRVHIFNQCGHWTQLEKAEEFNILVSSFLALP
jgi:2-hydroxy-6-oxonona-2,4-dienedioate hydrolase